MTSESVVRDVIHQLRNSPNYADLWSQSLADKLEATLSQPQPVAQGEAVACTDVDIPAKRTWEDSVRVMREAIGRWIVVDRGLWNVTKTDFVEGWRPVNEKPQAVCDLEFIMGPITKKNLYGYHVSIDDLAKSVSPHSPHASRKIATPSNGHAGESVTYNEVFETVWEESTDIGVIDRRAAQFVWNSALRYAQDYATPTIPTGHRVVPVEPTEEMVSAAIREFHKAHKGLGAESMNAKARRVIREVIHVGGKP